MCRISNYGISSLNILKIIELFDITLIYFRICTSNSRVASPLAMDMWGWSSEKTVRYLGASSAIGSCIATICFGSVGPLSKKIDERKLLIFMGLMPMIVARLITLPFGNTVPVIFNNSVSPNCKYMIANCFVDLTFGRLIGTHINIGNNYV